MLRKLLKNKPLETFKDIETIPAEMLEHDIFVKMPSKREYTIKAKIIQRYKAEPRIVVPEIYRPLSKKTFPM